MIRVNAPFLALAVWVLSDFDVIEIQVTQPRLIDLSGTFLRK
jgi:hypothetical protein